ncbi:hypothetical protein WA026_017054 [Henosepilachna vigintioctopunctata]|uniref:Disease resistance R13L4/SHOC-2-like LRR domain-containing protein n=1 Tax=Henosepilachna vigintioctopunctata TaxID=420089 RepID=A0AAW1TV25_9CUCU
MSCFICGKCSSTDEKIIELDYTRCGLSDVPFEVYSSSRTLEVLHLEGNKLRDLSPQLFQCIDLKYLNVGDNEINSLPPLISKLSNLQMLILSKNALVIESMSPNMDKLSKLTTLDISMNDLGKVPDSLMNLINLQQLYLNDIGIEYIPANIGRLSNLKILELRDNYVEELPKSIKRLTNLQRLDVSDNNLNLVEEIGESHNNLTELWLNGNNIDKLPETIIHLKKLNDLDASYNCLKSVPKDIGQCTKITNLILSFNNLDSLPRSIGNMRNLQILKLEGNCLDELPESISKLNNLEELNVQNNSLISIPSGIGHLRKLGTLIASNNRLSHLPTEIGSCLNLTILNVHHNYLTKLPDEIGHLQKLTTLGLIGNRLSYLPITISKLSSLRALWLTPNQTQPLIHLQNDQLDTGQVVLTSILFPQVPTQIQEEEPVVVHMPTITSQAGRITFSAEIGPTEARLNRTPTPYRKELRRLRHALGGPGTTQIREAKVTNITSDFIPQEQISLNTLKNINETNSVVTLKQPPPYYVAAAYSKNAHLFNDVIPNPKDVLPPPPSPLEKPKKFSQQPANMNLLKPQPRNGPSWPFGTHKVRFVTEIELDQNCQSDDFHIIKKEDGIYVDYVRTTACAFQKLQVGDKILALDDIDITVLDFNSAYQQALKKINNTRILTVSRYLQTNENVE